ncbi:hypothetical protein EVAR_43208_1 [Eumeta japonica]|uniref:Mos1 transposase HTH domain-containing protein n=1 Tax=Eumeta variegata TaxID=151549 RepID=A0A4C1WT87_EUMVA|nr:hypothetical protein EVAR_43208_1 [Eumeta japonica]
MSESNVEIRYIMKFYYKKKATNAKQVAKKICDAYGLNAVSVRVAQKIEVFQSSNFDVKDEPRSGRPVTHKVDGVLEKIEQDWHRTDYKIVLIHLKKAGWVCKKARYVGPTRAH